MRMDGSSKGPQSGLLGVVVADGRVPVRPR